MTTVDQQHDRIRAIVWRNDALELLDQRLLPDREEYLRLELCNAVADAIRNMVVRGAPAIGIAAAYAVVLAAKARYAKIGADWQTAFDAELAPLSRSRPTAVNLGWAIKRMLDRVATLGSGDPGPALLAEARAIHDEDVIANRRMGAFGSALIGEPCPVLTHCNTGSLATGGFGTALGVVRDGYSRGIVEKVYAGETRPWMQGARLTAWELAQDGIPVSLLADGAAPWLMRCGQVRWVIVGADRIAANGDTANKIGTYGLALAARRHGVHFMVVAPTSTMDPALADGAGIPIEERPPQEVLNLGGRRLAPEGACAWNPAFDVTPAELIDAIVTERGVVHHPDTTGLAELLTEK